jgi:hypothetical protein
MKNVFFFFLVCSLIFSVLSCKDRPGTDMAYTDFFEIRSGDNTLDRHYYVSSPINARWSDFLGDKLPEDINRITPSFARISNTDGIPFDFISEIIIEVFPNQDLSVDPFLEIAFRDGIPFNTGTTLELPPSLPDFKEEFADGEFVYQIGLRYREFPPATFRVVLDFGFYAEDN